MLDLFLPIFCFTLESYTVLLPEDNSYGVYSRNNWDGIMGMVINEVNLKFFLCFDWLHVSLLLIDSLSVCACVLR